MTFTYDVTTDRGKTRLLCTDTVSANAIFTDAEVDAFLGLNDSEPLLAAAMALDQMASKQAYVLKVITNNGLSTNGASVAAALRAQAQALRDQYDTVSSTFCGFDWAEYADNPFQLRELVWKEGLRGL